MLRAWADNPDRLREDANAEDDLALGGYRARVVVELAQNAADAAARAGQPGRLRLQLADGVLSAANTGAPLDAAGVRALASLRASAKRDGEAPAAGGEGLAGRFGVGFAAVAAVCDEASVRSQAIGVRFSRAATAEAVRAEGAPASAAELEARGGRAPLLRLPWPDAAAPAQGFTTEVVLPLRDGDAEVLVRDQLLAVDAGLLLALRWLAEVVVEVDGATRRLAAQWDRDQVVVRDGEARSQWLCASWSGEAPDALLADRPVEERLSPARWLRWAVPVDPQGRPVALPEGVPAVAHGPTPTAEPVDLPALLLGALPQDPSRTRVEPGPLADWLAARAADAYAGLAGPLIAATPEGLALVPGPAAAGVFDAALRQEIRERLLAAPPLGSAFTVPAAGAATVAVLAERLPGALAPRWSSTAARRTALRALHVEEADLADCLDGLGSGGDPQWWARMYAALASDDVAAGALDGLPVPLAGGGVARGPRGLLAGDGPAALLAAAGARVVHPEADHPLLRRLGVREADAAAVLALPGLAAAAHAPEAYDPEVLDALLGLLDQAGEVEAPLALGEWPVPLAGGGHAPARSTVLPGAPLAGLVDLPEVDAAVAARWPRGLARLGAASGLAVQTVPVVALDGDLGGGGDDGEGGAHADAWADWCDEAAERLDLACPGALDLASPPTAVEVSFLRPLDAVRPEAWRSVLALAGGDPVVRRCLVDPVRVVAADGRSAPVPGPAAWWIGRLARAGGVPLAELRLPGDDRLAGVYDEVPQMWVDDCGSEVLAAVGCRTTVEALLAEPDGPAELLDRLGDPLRAVAPTQTAALHRALSGVDPDRVDPPERVRGADGLVHPADDAVMASAPYVLPLLSGAGAVVVGDERLAELLDVPMAEVEAPARSAAAVERAVPDAVRRLLPEAPETYVEQDDLAVDWWVDEGDGPPVVRAATMDGLARGLAWASGRWSARHLAAEALADPDRANALAAEAAWD